MIRAILYEDNAQYDVLNIYLVRPFICFKLYSNSQKPFLLLLTSLNDFSAQWLMPWSSVTRKNAHFHSKNLIFARKISSQITHREYRFWYQMIFFYFAMIFSNRTKMFHFESN